MFDWFQPIRLFELYIPLLLLQKRINIDPMVVTVQWSINKETHDDHQVPLTPVLRRQIYYGSVETKLDESHPSGGLGRIEHSRRDNDQSSLFLLVVTSWFLILFLYVYNLRGWNERRCRRDDTSSRWWQNEGHFGRPFELDDQCGVYRFIRREDYCHWLLRDNQIPRDLMML